MPQISRNVEIIYSRGCCNLSGAAASINKSESGDIFIMGSRMVLVQFKQVRKAGGWRLEAQAASGAGEIAGGRGEDLVLGEESIEAGF